MSCDERLVQRVRQALAGTDPPLAECRMFGAPGFMLRGNIAVGVTNDELMVRTGPERFEAALAQPHAWAFEPAGRPTKGGVVVTPSGLTDRAVLREWIALGTTFARSLPAR